MVVPKELCPEHDYFRKCFCTYNPIIMALRGYHDVAKRVLNQKRMVFIEDTNMIFRDRWEEDHVSPGTKIRLMKTQVPEVLEPL